MANSAPSFFNGDGKVITAVGPGDDWLFKTLVQADGKIILTGYTRNGSTDDFTAVRYHADGSLDTTFGTGGIVKTPIGAADDLAISAALQADGKIVVAGHATVGGQFDFAVVRYNTDGTLDTTFGTGGQVTTPIGSSHDEGLSIVIQPDGKLVVSGSSFQGGNYDFAVVRYNSDGSRDTTFDSDGKVTTPIGGDNDIAYSLALQANGKVVVAGYGGTASGNDFMLARYNADGSLDTTFDGDGKVITIMGNGDDRGRAVHIQTDGKILVAGQVQKVSGLFDYDFALVRYNSDGSLDTGFGTAGKVITATSLEWDIAASIAVQSDGKIIVGGWSQNPDREYAVVRYNSNGSLDTTFGTGGIALVPVGMSDDNGWSLALQADGKIVVGGSPIVGGNADFGLIRLNSDGTLDLTFDGTNTLDGTASYTENGAGVVMDASVAIVDPELAAADNYASASLTLARQGGAVATDVFGGSGALTFSSGNAILGGVTIGTVTQSAGQLVLTFNASATQARVNQALGLLTFASTSDVFSVLAPTSVQVVWTFSDGAAVDPKSTTGSTTVNVTGVNDLHGGSLGMTGVDNGTTATLTAVTAGLTDLDGLTGAHQFVWQKSLDGTAWTPFAGPTSSAAVIPGAAEVGLFLRAVVTFTDNGGSNEQAISSVEAIIGDGDQNSLAGNARANLIMGLAGDDALVGGGGGDTFNGGAGTDLVSYQDRTVGVSVDLGAGSGALAAAGDVYISIENAEGGSGIDTLTGSGANNVLLGGGSGDNLYGLGGTDRLEGQDGNDGLYGGSDGDTLSGGAGQDFLVGDDGDDILWGGLIGSFTDVNNNTLVGGTGNDTLNGGAGVDSLFGDDGADTLNGGAGIDYLVGGYDLSADTLNGGGDGDNLYGFGGNDTLNGDGGDDGVYGGDGGDTLAGGDGQDFLQGENGNDVIWAGAAGSFTDVSNNTLVGGVGNDTLNGGAATDSLFGDDGADTLNGGAGIDYLVGGYDLSADALNGGDDGDNLYGFSGADTLHGDGGGDGLYGGDDGDFMFGDGGDDFMMGENGNDRLDGGLGNDTMVGGAGADTYAFGDAWSHDQIHGFEDGSDRIDMTPVTGLTSFSQLNLVDVNGSTLILFGGNSIFVLGVNQSLLTATDFDL